MKERQGQPIKGEKEEKDKILEWLKYILFWFCFKEFLKNEYFIKDKASNFSSSIKDQRD